MTPSDSDKRFFYNRIANEFILLDHPYDLERRLTLVFKELLSEYSLSGAMVLDAGCGYGAFSARAKQAGASVFSLDIADRLVKITTEYADTGGIVGDACKLSFRTATFDFVISSEMIEHTLSPSNAIGELARVLKPGGILVITTPNKIWQGPVRLASSLRLRPFQGLENFLSWKEIREIAVDNPLRVISHVGFHLWPFQFGFNRWSRAADHVFGEGLLGRWMINQALVAVKKSPR